MTSVGNATRAAVASVRRWRAGLFGPAAEEPFRRRTSDWIRVGVAIGLLVVAARHAGDVTASERLLFDLFNSLPSRLSPVFRSVYRLGALWAVGLVVAAALLGRRRRLARDLLLSGVLAWAIGRLLGEIVVEHESFGRSVRIAAGFGSSPASFPAVRAAITVAVISAASPYVGRATRVIGRVLVVGLVIAALYLGTAYPNDLFAGVVLGWAIAATVHLVFGSPGGRPTTLQVTRSLAQLGMAVHDVRLADPQPTGSTLVLASDDEGPLRVKVIGRDEADARFLAKLWRFVVYKDSGPRLTLTRLQQVEHEAYAMLIARDAGVRVPRVVVAGTAGPGAALLVIRPVGGRSLAALDGEDVDDALLDQLWKEVAALHDARIVHGALDAEHVVVTAEGPWLVGFDDADSTGMRERLGADVAELLVATAALAGEDRAVRAAVGALGPERLAAALPFLQPTALSRSTRELAGEGRRELHDHLERLRERGAEATGIAPPQLTRLWRISATNAGLAIGTLVAVAVLLGDVGDPAHVWATVRGAEWSWLLVALVLSLASNVGYAIALQGTVPVRLPLGPTTELELAMSFSNLAVPAIGGTGMQVRFLQKMGVDLSSAVAAGGLLSVIGNVVVALGLFALAFAIEPAHVDFGLLPTTGLVELTIGVVIVVILATAVAMGVPALRRTVVPPLYRAATTIGTSLRSPRLLGLLIGGNVLAALLSTWCLQACLVAFGGHASFWALLAANLAVVTIASTVPVPGGGTAVGTVGLSGALVTFGVREDIAVAAVLANQLAFYYLPAVPGWFATRHLLRRDYL